MNTYRNKINELIRHEKDFTMFFFDLSETVIRSSTQESVVIVFRTPWSSSCHGWISELNHRRQRAMPTSFFEYAVCAIAEKPLTGFSTVSMKSWLTLHQPLISMLVLTFGRFQAGETDPGPQAPQSTQSHQRNCENCFSIPNSALKIQYIQEFQKGTSLKDLIIIFAWTIHILNAKIYDNILNIWEDIEFKIALRVDLSIFNSLAKYILNAVYISRSGSHYCCGGFVVLLF